ncbi:MAG TPA: hypothetical protein PKM72_07525, partial [Nitrospirales bacterium]|nr:hypothetical protein [Nitrospirales bacterium]
FYGKGYEDSDRRIPDISKAEALIGWKPQWGLNELLENTMDYYVNHVNTTQAKIAPALKETHI